MLSRGTMEREDEEPPKFRQTLAVRPEEDEEGTSDGGNAEAAAIDAMSEAAGSEIMNESVVSSVVDK